MVKVIINIYINNQNYVITQWRISKPFSTKEGQRQGGGLSPTLFITFIYEIIEECSLRTKKLHLGYRNLRGVDISEGAFADDIVIMADTANQLQKNLELWNNILKKNGMTLHKNKTKVMLVGKEGKNIYTKMEGTDK